MEHSLAYIALAMLIYCMYSLRFSAVGIALPFVIFFAGLAVGDADPDLGDGALL